MTINNKSSAQRGKRASSSHFRRQAQMSDDESDKIWISHLCITAAELHSSCTDHCKIRVDAWKCTPHHFSEQKKKNDNILRGCQLTSLVGKVKVSENSHLNYVLPAGRHIIQK